MRYPTANRINPKVTQITHRAHLYLCELRIHEQTAHRFDFRPPGHYTCGESLRIRTQRRLRAAVTPLENDKTPGATNTGG